VATCDPISQSSPAVAATSSVSLDIEAAAQAIGVRPETALRIMSMANNSETPIAKLQEVIDSDPSMAMKTLKLANSAFFGMKSRVSRIDRAITLLGMSNVAKLAASTSVESAFRDIKIDGPGLTSETPWRFSLAVAFATEVTINHTFHAGTVQGRRLIAQAFVAGLIHDIGVLVQAKLHGKKFAEAVAASHQSGVPLDVEERRLVGIDHADIGKRLAGHWELPPELIHAIGYHADPMSADAEHRPLAAVIHATTQFVRKADVPALDGDTDAPNLAAALELLRIDPRDADKVIADVKEKVTNLPI
jgi:HD-like signal output (HDOD) protein